MAEKKEAKTMKTVKPSWIKIKKEELESIVVELAKSGKTPGQIGLILRDKYGVPKAKLLGKKIRDILDEKKVSYKADKDVVDEKIKKLKEHIAKNKQDHRATRALTKRLWDLYRLKKSA